MISELHAEVASQDAIREIREVLDLLLIYEVMKFFNAPLDFSLDFLSFFLRLLLLVVIVCDTASFLAHHGV